MSTTGRQFFDILMRTEAALLMAVSSKGQAARVCIYFLVDFNLSLAERWPILVTSYPLKRSEWSSNGMVGILPWSISKIVILDVIALPPDPYGRPSGITFDRFVRACVAVKTPH